MNLYLKLRDHLVDRIPLNTPVIVIEMVGDSGFGVNHKLVFDFEKPRVFTAYLREAENYDEDKPVVEFDLAELDPNRIVAYDHPLFASVNAEVVVELDDGYHCSGQAFLEERYLWCLATDVGPEMKAIIDYFDDSAARLTHGTHNPNWAVL